MGQGHPPQLRVRPRRRRQQDLGRRRRAGQRLDRDDVAGSRRCRDGPGSPLQGSFQPAQQVQEAVPEREDDGVGGRLGRDRRLLRRQRQAGRLRRLLLDGDQRRRLGQPGRDQHLRRLDRRLHQEVRLQRRRHRLRVPDHDEGRGQPAGLDPVQRPPGRSGQELRRADEDAAREARPGVHRRRQALPAQRRGPLLRLSAARHGDLPGPEVPGLRQHHVVRPARRLERVRRPERRPVRRRQGRRTRAGERLLHLAVRRHRLPQHRLGLPLLPRFDAVGPDQHRAAVLHPRLQERTGRHQRPVGQGGLHRLPGRRGADQVRGRRRRHRQPLARPGHQRQGGTGRLQPDVAREEPGEGRGRRLRHGLRIPRGHEADRHLRPQLRLHTGRAVAVERTEEGLPLHRGRAVGEGQGRLRGRPGHRRHDDLGARGRLRLERGQGPVRTRLHPHLDDVRHLQVRRAVRGEALHDRPADPGAGHRRVLRPVPAG